MKEKTDRMVPGKVVASLVLAFLFLLAGALPGAAGAKPAIPNALVDIVAVGCAPGRIVLATPALPLGAMNWRLRTIRLEPETENPREVVLSRGASKLLIVFADGSSGLADLTQKIKTIQEGHLPEAQHRLPGETLISGGGLIASGTAWETAAIRVTTDTAPEIMTAAKSLPQMYRWSFFHVQPEIAIYSPVLEFAPGEPDVPSRFSIWERIAPLSKGATAKEYHAAYDSLGDEQVQLCNVYYRTSSYPGSWLIEYWYYYPFDEGKPHAHIHDAEHLFVEVDKLGGAVRSVLANAHDSLAPNNLYSTFQPDAHPVSLPLYALVELGKHAMSPDIDGDGRFNSRVDVNNGVDHYQAYGVRDIGGKSAKLMRPYRNQAALPREMADRMAVKGAEQWFPGLKVPENRQTCELQPLPESEPTCTTCTIGSEEGAREYLLGNSDQQRPTNIYKNWVLPARELRLGIGIFDHLSRNRQMFAGYVLNLRQLTNRRFPFAGRLSLETMYSPVGQNFRSPDGKLKTTMSNALGFGMRFERFLTTAQGFYGGVSWWVHRDATRIVGGPMVDPAHWDFDKTWYRLGYVIELPSLKKGNLVHHVGIAFRPAELRTEWHISLGAFRRNGRRHFGIDQQDWSPY